MHLQNRGFSVQKVESTGELKRLVESGYVRWCVEEGVPEEILRDKRRFWTFLEWVSENPHLREGLVKTGWASWERKWRNEIYSKPLKLRGWTSLILLATQSPSRVASCSLCSRSFSSFLNFVVVVSISILSGGAMNLFSCRRRLFWEGLGTNIVYRWFSQADNFCPNFIPPKGAYEWPS